MEVKCYLTQGAETDRSMKDLLSLARNNGQTSLSSLINDRDVISLSKNRGGLVVVGGRESISQFFYFSGGMPYIVGSRPFLITTMRKHRIFGKNESCIKMVCGTGHPQPEDGSPYVTLDAKPGSGGTGLTMNPVEMGHFLYFQYGWG